MATLWRGVAGADLVVHVRGGYEDGQAGVEVKSGGLIGVKVAGGGEGANLDEKFERRLRFEVEEWVRGGGWGGTVIRDVGGGGGGRVGGGGGESMKL